MASLASTPQCLSCGSCQHKNTCVEFLSSHTPDQRVPQKQERDPSAFIWMHQNFTNSWQNISSGRMSVLFPPRYPTSLMLNSSLDGLPSLLVSPIKMSAIFFLMVLPFTLWHNLCCRCLEVAHLCFSTWEVRSVHPLKLNLIKKTSVGGLVSALVSMGYANLIDKQDRPAHGASGKRSLSFLLP